jgi:hypothetical protein
MKEERTYVINEQYFGLLITRSILGVGEVTLDTNRDYSQGQLENLQKIFPQVIEIINKEKEEPKGTSVVFTDEPAEILNLEEMSYNELYALAKKMGIEFEQKPKKIDLLEALKQVEDYSNE